MEKNEYYTSLKNPKIYSPYQINNNKLRTPEKIRKKDIIIKPSTLTPKIILNNDNNNKKNLNQYANDYYINNSFKKFPSHSLIFQKQNNININENEEKNDINNILKEQYIKFDDEDTNISRIHWKYVGNTGLNTEKKHFPHKSNIGNYFKNITNKKSENKKYNEPSFINSYEFNSNFINGKKGSKLFNSFNDDNIEKKKEFFNNNISKSQKILNNPVRTKNIEKLIFYNDNKNINQNNLYKSKEKPQSMKILYNNNKINEMFNEENSVEIDKDNFNGNERYKYYNPRRYDYKGSSYGDYTYNYYLNAPMRGDKSQSWKYPPIYYYNFRNNFPVQNNGY